MEKHRDRTVTVTAKKIGINGEGIAYLEGKPVFVDQLLPGEAARDCSPRLAAAVCERTGCQKTE